MFDICFQFCQILLYHHYRTDHHRPLLWHHLRHCAWLCERPCDAQNEGLSQLWLSDYDLRWSTVSHLFWHLPRVEHHCLYLHCACHHLLSRHDLLT